MKSKGAFILFILMTGLYFCYILFNNHGYLKVKALDERKLLLLEDNMKIEKEINDLSRRVNRMKSDRKYIEYIMRNEFNMVSEDETIIYMGK